MRERPLILLSLIAATTVAACSPKLGVSEQRVALIPPTARAELRDSAGRAIGEVTLEETPHGLLVLGAISGLLSGVHGLHIHSTGECRPPFTSAGPHFNPGNKKHGVRNTEGAHAGDAPNISVDANGTAKFDALLAGASLELGSHPVLDSDGAAIIVHAAADDYRTDPSGNSGGRIACGVIERQTLRP
ncbi:MAG: superoxide dismutase family protein [Gemmatimonadaceae bacterium]